MATFTTLTDELSECEKHNSLLRQRAEDSVVEATERVQMVADKREELLLEHKRRVERLLEVSEQQIENVAEKAGQDIAEAVEGKRLAGEKVLECNRRFEEAEIRSKQLEREMKALHAELNRTVASHERRLVEVREAADNNVKRCMRDTDQKVRDTSILAHQEQETGLHSIVGLQEDLKRSLQRTDGDAESRSRYRDVYSLSLSRSGREVSEGDFASAKDGHVHEWFDEWVQSTHAPAAKQGLGFAGRQPSVALSGSAPPAACADPMAVLRVVDGLGPNHPTSPRAKDRGRQRAEIDARRAARRATRGL